MQNMFHHWNQKASFHKHQTKTGNPITLQQEFKRRKGWLQTKLTVSLQMLKLCQFRTKCTRMDLAMNTFDGANFHHKSLDQPTLVLQNIWHCH